MAQQSTIEILDKPVKEEERSSTYRRFNTRAIPSLIYDMRKQAHFLKEEVKRLRRINKRLRDKISQGELSEEKCSLYWE